MIERKTVINNLSVDREGNLSVQFGLLLVEDGVEIDCKWHRTMIPPDIDPEAQLNEVHKHLESMGVPAEPEADSNKVKAFHTLSRIFHPQVSPEDKVEASQRFKQAVDLTDEKAYTVDRTTEESSDELLSPTPGKD